MRLLREFLINCVGVPVALAVGFFGMSYILQEMGFMTLLG